MGRQSLSIWCVLALLCAVGSAACGAVPAGLRGGAARLDITTPADPQNPPSGKYEHERLYVRAIVLDSGSARAVLIGADQGGFTDAIWSAAAKQISAEVDCPIENIVISVTHSHSAWVAGMGGPPGPGRPGGEGGRGMPGVAPSQPPPPIVGQLVQVTRQAEAKLQPAKFGFGTGFCYLNVNRDTIDPETHLWTQAPNLEGASDKTVAVLKFETPAGEPIAVHVNYAMHPVNLRLGVVGIGNTALTWVNAETYSAIGMRLKKQSPLANTFLVTVANGRSNSGYVPNDAAFGAYTFQVLGSRLKPGCAETSIANELTEMITRYVQEPSGRWMSGNS